MINETKDLYSARFTWLLEFLQSHQRVSLSSLLSQLTLWDGPVEDSEVGREAFLSDGAVGVDCQSQNPCVGDDPAGGVLTTVPPNVRPDCRRK